MTFAQDAKDLVDEHEYAGKLTFKVNVGSSATGDGGTTTTIGTVNMSMKKVLPTDAPATFSAKENQIVNGKYLCYVLPAGDIVAEKDGDNDGYMKLVNSFNLNTDFTAWNGDEAQYQFDKKYIFIFEDAREEDNQLKDVVVRYDSNSDSEYKLVVDNDFILSHKDNTAKTTRIRYDYGDISYVYDEVKNKFENSNVTVDVTVAGKKEFETEFRCIASAQTWAWAEGSSFLGKKDTDQATVGQLNYGISLTEETSTYTLTAMVSKNSYDNLAYGGTFKDFWLNKNILNGEKWDLNLIKAALVKAEMITNATGEVNEYFEPSIDKVLDGKDAGIQFKVVPQDAAPQADVPSTLRLTFKDVFGHETVVELPMNVHIDKGE